MSNPASSVLQDNALQQHSEQQDRASLHIVSADDTYRLAEGDRLAVGAISIRSLNQQFSGKNNIHHVLHDITLDILPGQFVAFLGPSGCGKSTLLNLVAGITQPTSGHITIDGVKVREPTPLCNVVFQHHSLFPWMTALKNVSFGPEMQGHPEPERVARELLRMTGLESFGNSYPSTLSGGMQQRVAIARALATNPTVLLMDEPFGALDAQTRSLMQEELLKTWSRYKTTVVFITHDIDEAIYLSDRTIVMATNPGTVKQDILIDLPRPRSPDIIQSTEFCAIRQRIVAQVREESLKTFESGEVHA